MLVPLIGFGPDLDPTTPGVILECSQLIPSLNGMRAAPSTVATTYPALSEASTGSALLVKLSGSNRFFSGGATLLQEGTAGAWANVSRAGNYTATDNRWRFAQFGDDSIAANKSCQLQRSTSGAFANLTAPKADVCETVAGFVMLANCDDSGTGIGTAYGDGPNRWWCSGIYDVTLWVPSIATQSATGLLVDAPGPIRALRRLGSNVIVYKDKAIFLGSYVGAQAGVWRFDLIPGEIGCSSQEAVINIGTAHLFIGDDDFYIFDGSRPVPIGAPVRTWFFARLLKTQRSKIAGYHDRTNGLAWWYYPSTASTSGALDSAIVYDYRTKRWGLADRSIEMPIDIILTGITYDNLGTLYSTYDDLPAISYDSPFWTSGTPVQAVIGTDHRPYTIAGVPGSWWFKTGITGDDQAVTLARRVNIRWITKPTAATLTPFSSMDEGQTLTAGGAAMMGASGRIDYLKRARWHQQRIDSSGTAELVGLDLELQGAGRE